MGSTGTKRAPEASVNGKGKPPNLIKQNAELALPRMSVERRIMAVAFAFMSRGEDAPEWINANHIDRMAALQMIQQGRDAK